MAETVYEYFRTIIKLCKILCLYPYNLEKTEKYLTYIGILLQILFYYSIYYNRTYIQDFSADLTYANSLIDSVVVYSSIIGHFIFLIFNFLIRKEIIKTFKYFEKNLNETYFQHNIFKIFIFLTCFILTITTIDLTLLGLTTGKMSVTYYFDYLGFPIIDYYYILSMYEVIFVIKLSFNRLNNDFVSNLLDLDSTKMILRKHFELSLLTINQISNFGLPTVKYVLECFVLGCCVIYYPTISINLLIKFNKNPIWFLFFDNIFFGVVVLFSLIFICCFWSNLEKEVFLSKNVVVARPEVAFFVGK